MQYRLMVLVFFFLSDIKKFVLQFPFFIGHQ